MQRGRQGRAGSAGAPLYEALFPPHPACPFPVPPQEAAPAGAGCRAPSVAGRAPTAAGPPEPAARTTTRGALPKAAGAKPELPAQRVAVDPGSSCDLRQVFQVPACQTHTQILKQSPKDLRGSCFTHFWSLPAPVPGPIALPQEEIAMEKPVIPTEEQLEILEYHFCKVNKHPDPTTLCLIAAETGLSEEQTLKWFKQRLAEWRKSEGLPSESGSVRD
ncbi:homeodomain-only protein [Parus major]|uniref:homeodomain-only protein n=1 Tax=Parus major TaxID=9157 RepID=UPI0007713D7B|nr:homeodomain-only protein [Parus major]